MIEEITGKDGIIGEPPDTKPIGWFSWRMLEMRRKLVCGRRYTVRHRSYYSGTGQDKLGRIVNTNMTLAGKYPHGALFWVDKGWHEFFTWAELAAGGLRRF